MRNGRWWHRSCPRRGGEAVHGLMTGRASTVSSMCCAQAADGRTCREATVARSPAGAACTRGKGMGPGTASGAPSSRAWISRNGWTGSIPSWTVAPCLLKRGAQGRLLRPAPSERDQAAPGGGWQEGASGLAPDGCPGARQPGRLAHPETPEGRAEATTSGPGGRQGIRQPPAEASSTMAGYPGQYPRAALPAPQEAGETTPATPRPGCPSLGSGAHLCLVEQRLSASAGPLRAAGIHILRILRPRVHYYLPRNIFEMSCTSLLL